jgi:hypothetical protein
VRVLNYHGGSAKTRDDALEAIRQRGGILLTTYGMITTNAGKLHAAMASTKGQQWDYVVCVALRSFVGCLVFVLRFFVVLFSALGTLC